MVILCLTFWGTARLLSSGFISVRHLCLVLHCSVLRQMCIPLCWVVPAGMFCGRGDTADLCNETLPGVGCRIGAFILFCLLLVRKYLFKDPHSPRTVACRFLCGFCVYSAFTLINGCILVFSSSRRMMVVVMVMTSQLIGCFPCVRHCTKSFMDIILFSPHNMPEMDISNPLFTYTDQCLN